ncbi:Glycerophosphocholine permease [Alternaria gaisen]|uniref:Glycerophosphocholine permease n=1 Tax=Alternaria gaisen TaxID=167740 RepID=A0ACB6G2B6_9PLEO|nr:Glycerophosphocholine permease [Alternaria gaisen]
MASAAEVQPGLYNATDEKGDIERRGSVARTEKGRWERLWPVIACGAGLFSDGYLNNIIGPVNTMLKTIYPDSYANSSAQANVASIGGEYPAGSVGCAESTGELKQGTRNKWFILFTNVQIDLAFFISAIVATVVVLATGENHLRAAWRICLGIGVIPPLSLLYLRLKLQEPEAFKRESLAKAKTPWLLIIKYYWFRLSIVSIIWFIYDFSAYSFGIYATSILANLLGESAPLWKSLAWNILINFFYMPGCLAGAFVADLPSMGPKKTLFIGVTLQGIIGFIMAGCYPWLNKPENVAGFVVVYGIFLALGEFGPGDNIGLVASKTCATGIRGQYYGIAAAVGKIGAFAGSYALDALQKAAGDDEIAAGRNPFFVASTLAFVAAGLVLLLPHIGQDTIDQEDIKFREYLTANGYDTSKMGLQSGDATGVEGDENGVVPVEQTYVK